MSGGRPPQPIAVLISGRGSNLRAIVEQGLGPAPCYRVALVLSDKPDAPGLGIARDYGIATRTAAAQNPADRAAYERSLTAAIDECAPSLIVLAGFMRILSGEFVGRYAGRILNIHPSLLPKYPGLHTHQSVLAARDPEHGATVHFVTPELDAGPAIIQARVKVEPADTEVTLAERVRVKEHRIYPLAVRWYCEGRLRCRDHRAWLDGKALAQPVSYDDP